MSRVKGKGKESETVSGRLVEIELPLEGTNTKLNINPTTTAQQVHDTIMKRPFYENTTYAFSLASSSARNRAYPPDTILAKEQTVRGGDKRVTETKTFFSLFYSLNSS